MTTPVNTFQDILDAMKQDPKLAESLRQHILTKELLQMPARLERTEDDIRDLKEGQARLESDVKVLKEGQARLESDVKVLKEGQARLESDVKGLKTDVLGLKTDVKTINENVAKLGGDVSNLKGADYESHVATYLPRYLRRQLNIEATVFFTQKNKPPLVALMDEAEKRGRVSQDETDRLNNTDIILSVNRNGGYVLGEISITIQQDDIARAVERAAILAKATGADVMPIAVGETEEDGLDKQGVKALLIQHHQDD